MNAMKTIIIMISYHHGNTEKVAKAFARVLDSQIRSPEQIGPEELLGYDLVGFGSGIYDEKHHKDLLALADALPPVIDKKAFIFSTCSIVSEGQITEQHETLRKKLQSKGYAIVDEFSCRGFNTNSFLRRFGGMNKGRPSAEDLRRAENFARSLISKSETQQ